MSKVIFDYKGNEVLIQCNASEKFKDIFKRFSSKINKDPNKLIFLYGGKKLEENLSFESQAFSDDKMNNKMHVLVYDIDDMNNNVDVNKLQKDLNKILSTYLDDRKYLENKVGNWQEAIFKESEKIFLIYPDYKTFIHLTIYDKTIKGNNLYRDFGLYSNIDFCFNLEFESQKIKAILNVAMLKRNKKRTKTDIAKIITQAENEFLNLAEGREYDIFMKKYYKIFEEKFEKEIVSGHKYSLFYIIEFSNKYYKSSKGFKIINGEKDDYFLNKYIDSGDIKFYIALGKGNSP